MWFSASLFFEGVHNDCPNEDDVWEQSVFLIWAASEEEAMLQAQKLAKEREVEYITAIGDRVRWVFRHVESVFELFDAELKAGIEVYSRFLRANDVRSLLTSFEDSQDLQRKPEER
jgi:hypothetical protein